MCWKGPHRPHGTMFTCIGELGCNKGYSVNLKVKGKGVKLTLKKAYHETRCIKTQPDELANPSSSNSDPSKH